MTVASLPSADSEVRRSAFRVTRAISLLAERAFSCSARFSSELEKYYGGWHVLTVDEPRSFTFEDFFADESFAPAEAMPVAHCDYTFEPEASGTKAVFTTTYPSAEALQQVLDMGMEEGASQAIGQIDAFLAEL